MHVQYRVLEHPADLGIEAWGENHCAAFEHAVLGLVYAMVDPSTIESRESRSVVLKALDHHGLLVKLLSEVVYLYDGERFLTGKAKITRITQTDLEGRLFGETFDEEKHRPKSDVKAITYHQISVREQPDGVHVTVFVDI